MTDQEIIITSLRKVERRLRANRLCSDLSYALALFLLFPLALKVSDLFIGFTGTTIAVTVGLWFVAFAGYSFRLLRKKVTLASAAASADKRVALNDELKTAYWFIENPRSSHWVDVLIERAARSAQKIDVDRMFPRAIPHTFLYSAAILALVVALNFIPTSMNHNWLAPEAAPAADALADADVDLAEVAVGLEEIARDMQQSEQLEETAEDLLARNLPEAATELREVAGDLANISPEDLRDMRQSLAEASEHSRPGLERLSRNLKRAADGLQKQDQQETEEALEEAALELEQLSKKIEAQLSRNAGRQPPRIPGQTGQGSSEDGATLAQTQQGAGWDGPLPQDKVVSNAPPGNAPMGLEPSGEPVPNPPRYGPPTSLQVQLQREKLEGQISELKQPDEEASREERSTLDYRNVPSDLRPAQKDVLNQDSIPSKYRDLIRNYFQAIRPPE